MRVRTEDIERAIELARERLADELTDDDIVSDYAGTGILQAAAKHAYEMREDGDVQLVLTRLVEFDEQGCERRSEAAYERQVSDYYGGDGPVTVREQCVAARRTA